MARCAIFLTIAALQIIQVHTVFESFTFLCRLRFVGKCVVISLVSVIKLAVNTKDDVEVDFE